MTVNSKVNRLQGFLGLFIDTSEHTRFLLFSFSVFPLFSCWFQNRIKGALRVDSCLYRGDLSFKHTTKFIVIWFCCEVHQQYYSNIYHKTEHWTTVLHLVNQPSFKYSQTSLSGYCLRG